VFESSWTVEAREIAIIREMSASSGGGLRCAKRDGKQFMHLNYTPHPHESMQALWPGICRGESGDCPRMPDPRQHCMRRVATVLRDRGHAWSSRGDDMHARSEGLGVCVRAAGKVLPWEERGTREGLDSEGTCAFCCCSSRYDCTSARLFLSRSFTLIPPPSPDMAWTLQTSPRGSEKEPRVSVKFLQM
jgi:hypothetical protein